MQEFVVLCDLHNTFLVIVSSLFTLYVNKLRTAYTFDRGSHSAFVLNRDTKKTRRANTKRVMEVNGKEKGSINKEKKKNEDDETSKKVGKLKKKIRRSCCKVGRLSLNDG